MNTRLLKKVVKFFEQEPRRLDMEEWHNGENLRKYKPPCGTTACIAGAACILSGVATKNEMTGKYDIGFFNEWDIEARKVLDLNKEQSSRLFFHTRKADRNLNLNGQVWPVRFRKAYRAAKTAAQRLKVTRERIQHFIDTKGAE